MSEPTLAELAAIGAPLLKAGEQALAPEAEKVLTDLRGLVSGEMDRLRTELPAVVEQGTAHLHNLGEALLSRYHALMGHIDGLLTGATPAAPAVPPTQSVVSSPPVSTSSESTAAAPSPSTPAADPTPATPQSPSTSTTTASEASPSSSESSSTDSAVAVPATDEPAA